MLIEFGYRDFIIRKVENGFKVLNRRGFTHYCHNTLEMCQIRIDELIEKQSFNQYTQLVTED